MRIVVKDRELVSRLHAAELRAQIIAVADVELDFAGVSVICLSFADELFGRLVETHGLAWIDRHLKVTNTSPRVAGRIDAAIERALRR